jgi:hypothetical protein
MDLPQEENKRSNKTLLIGVVVFGVFILVVIGFFIFRKLGKTPVAPTIENSNKIENTDNSVNTSSNEPLPTGNGAYYDVQPGLNRQLTSEEKIKYHFPDDADVWIKTTVPTDGTKPNVYFSQGPTQK